MPLTDLFSNKSRATVAPLYGALVAQARSPALFDPGGAPDTLDGRFDSIALHVALALRRLRATGEGAAAQALFDALFDDMDRGLRELGVGDVSVGRKIKEMAKALYGRIAAYEAGLVGRGGELEAALARNLYGTVEVGPVAISSMAAYVRSLAAVFDRTSAADLIAGRLTFPEFQRQAPAGGPDA